MSAPVAVERPLDEHPCFLSGDVAYFMNSDTDIYLHMTADEHDVGCMWKERNHWHLFTMTVEGGMGVPLHGGDCVWLVGRTGKCVDATHGGPVVSQPRSLGPAQQLCLVPLHPDGSPNLGESIWVGTPLQLRVGGLSGGCLQATPNGAKIGVASAGARGTTFTVQCGDTVPTGSPYWADPSRTSENRVPAHVALRSHRTEEAAIARRDDRLCLSGAWQFQLLDCPADVPASFGSAGIEGDGRMQGWRPIQVPSHWQLPHSEASVSDRPIYTNISYPWKQWPPHVPRSGNPTGLYRTAFVLPSAWCVGAEPTEVCLKAGGPEPMPPPHVSLPHLY